MKKKFYFIALIIGMVTFFFLMSTGGAEAQKKTTLRWGTSKAGSSGYVTLFGVAKVVNDRTGDIYIEVVPTGGSIASQRMFGKGELDGCYSGGWNLKDLYENRGPYEKSPYPAKAIKPYQTWYSFNVKQFIITRADRADIKHWGDLAGKIVFPPTPGSALFEVDRAALTALGIWEKLKIVNIPYTAVSDSLKMGTVDAVIGYTSGDILAPWMAEVDARVKIKIIPPTPEHQEILKKKSVVTTATLNTKDAFSQDVGVGKTITFAEFYGFHIGKNLGAKDVYRIFKILVENAEEVAKIHAMLKEYAQDPIGMQVDAIGAAPEIPVHPGVAKYLKEKRVWQNKWKVGQE